MKITNIFNFRGERSATLEILASQSSAREKRQPAEKFPGKLPAGELKDLTRNINPCNDKFSLENIKIYLNFSKPRWNGSLRSSS